MNALDVIGIRKNLGLSQADFGKLVGVDKRTIINYEQGKPIPPSRVEFFKMMLANGIGTTPVEKKEKEKENEKEITKYNIDSLLSENKFLEKHIDNLKEFLADKTKLIEVYKVEGLLNEIESLKEHISTLKEFIVEKTKVADIYELENKALKERIKELQGDENIEQK